MEHKKIIAIIGIMAVLIFAGIVYASDPQTVGDLKLGDTVTYNGKETKITKIESGAGFSDNPNILGIELESGEYITKVNDAPLSSASMTFVRRAGSAAQPAPTPAPAATPAEPAKTPTPAATPAPAPAPAPQPDTTTFGQLKKGDTVWYNGQQATVSTIVPATGNPNRVYIYLGNSADPIVGNKNELITSREMTKNAPAGSAGTTPAAGGTAPAGGTTPAPAQPASTSTAEDYKKYTPTQYTEWTQTDEGKAHKEVTYDNWVAREKQKETAAKQTALAEWESKRHDMKTPVTLGETPSIALQFLNAYSQYSGLSKFGSLFFTGDAWETYREKVNQIFCDTILLGGTKCITSRICNRDFYRMVPSNVFAGRTPNGERIATATIQGEKSLPIAAIDETGAQVDMRVYKVTYAIRNPNDAQDLKYNVQFRTEEGQSFDWYDERQTLGPGTSRAVTEDRPLIDYGTHDYKEVCLTFNPSIIDYRNYHGRRINEWCSDIVQYMGTATKPYPEATNDTTITTDPNAGQPPTIPTTSNRRPGF